MSHRNVLFVLLALPFSKYSATAEYFLKKPFSPVCIKATSKPHQINSFTPFKQLLAQLVTQSGKHKVELILSVDVTANPDTMAVCRPCRDCG